MTTVGVSSTLAPPGPPSRPASTAALGWWRQLPALAHIARTRAAAMYAYRNTMLLFLGVSVVQIFMLKKVWGALYAARPGVLAISLGDLIVYLTVANLIVWSFPTHTVSRYLRERIREGSVVFDLMRPVSFVPQMIAQLVGALGGALVIIVIALPVVAFAGSLALPADASAAGMFLVSLLCAYAIAGLLALLLAMVAFWTLEIDGLTMLYVLVSGFLSGALVPVSVFPGVLRTLVAWLPFQATTYVPASIYVGALDGAAAWRSIGVQLAWVAVLGVLAALVWRRAMLRVVVQGG
ncbi:ABC-2 family transporter protein [Cellulomonas sp. KRMCY2]|uniref:ABC transporter permease n=1 Tax=Cellulomonas sp. KRMCY2 TaxID=1304865 RepID=UPI00045EB137|nr:ABC-2 family transporter protein [Cellulomonas sp. KRMCY2]